VGSLLGGGGLQSLGRSEGAESDYESTGGANNSSGAGLIRKGCVPACVKKGEGGRRIAGTCRPASRLWGRPSAAWQFQNICVSISLTSSELVVDYHQ
jgi:hypothetical protein